MKPVSLVRRFPACRFPMRVLLPLLLLGALAVRPAAGQSVDDRYHEAARLYIGGQTARAEATAEAALREAPSHGRLRALLDLIRQEQDGGGAGSAGQGPPQPGDADDGRQPGPGTPDPTAPPDDAPPEPGDERDGDGGNGEDGAPRPGERSAPARSGDAPALSADEAERLLRAIEADERESLRRAMRRPARRTTGPDW